MTRHSRLDLSLIASLIPKGSSALDIGCGDGELLRLLKDSRDVRGFGLEIEAQAVNRAVASGLSVVQGNANTDLGDYPEQAFDTVILSNSVQALLHPDEALKAALRIGKQAIVSFPNFGHWQLRWHLLTKGTMPQSRSLPATWYNTQNIHLCTIKDFITFAKERNFTIHKAYGLGADEQPRRFDPNQAFRANLFSEAALFILSRP